MEFLKRLKNIIKTIPLLFILFGCGCENEKTPTPDTTLYYVGYLYKGKDGNLYFEYKKDPYNWKDGKLIRYYLIKEVEPIE